MLKTKWLIYTVIIGLLPLLIRIFIFIVRVDLTIEYAFNIVDMVAFGLVLHVANINELEDKKDIDQLWKTRNIGMSVIMLILFSVFLALGYLSELSDGKHFNIKSLKVCTIILGIVSLVISYSIYNRINAMKKN